MAQRKTGTVVHKELISPALMRFRLAPEDGSQFPTYEAGQSIALRRDDCKLTRRNGVGQDGKPTCEPEFDPWGRQTVGPLTHSFSITSAPSDTSEHGWIEFFVGLDQGLHGLPGRLSEALFGTDTETGCDLTYYDAVTGTFTLDKMAQDAQSVLMVGTGTGVAPFVSMLKTLQATSDGGDGRRYTLVHTSRTEVELGYQETLFEIEAAGRFDFMYIPTISRPSPNVTIDPRIGQGRASNVVRHIYCLPTAEEDKQTSAKSDVSRVAAELALARLVHPVLPRHLRVGELGERVDPAATVLLTCGNPASMADLRTTAGRRGVRFEVDEW
jgi:ferredoxin-NADP reductase